MPVLGIHIRRERFASLDRARKSSQRFEFVHSLREVARHLRIWRELANYSLRFYCRHRCWKQTKHTLVVITHSTTIRVINSSEKNMPSISQEIRPKLFNVYKCFQRKHLLKFNYLHHSLMSNSFWLFNTDIQKSRILFPLTKLSIDVYLYFIFIEAEIQKKSLSNKMFFCIFLL